MFREASGWKMVVHVGIGSRVSVVHVVLIATVVCVRIVVLRRHVAIVGDEGRTAGSTMVGGELTNFERSAAG